MRLRLLLLALLLVLTLGLAACGGDDDDGEDAAATVTQTDAGITGDTNGTTGATTGDDGEGDDGDGDGDAEAGAQVYAEAGCGGCHTLAAAGSTGSVGPNLDESEPDEDLVIERVTNGMGAMPSFRDQLTEQQIRDVAEYVSESAGEDD